MGCVFWVQPYQPYHPPSVEDPKFPQGVREVQYEYQNWSIQLHLKLQKLRMSIHDHCSDLCYLTPVLCSRHVQCLVQTCTSQTHYAVWPASRDLWLIFMPHSKVIQGSSLHKGLPHTWYAMLFRVLTALREPLSLGLLAELSLRTLQRKKWGPATCTGHATCFRSGTQGEACLLQWAITSVLLPSEH